MESGQVLEIVDTTCIAIDFACARQPGMGLIGQAKVPDQQVPAAVIDIDQRGFGRSAAVARVQTGLECPSRLSARGVNTGLARHTRQAER